MTRLSGARPFPRRFVAVHMALPDRGQHRAQPRGCEAAGGRGTRPRAARRRQHAALRTRRCWQERSSAACVAAIRATARSAARDRDPARLPRAHARGDRAGLRQFRRHGEGQLLPRAPQPQGLARHVGATTMTHLSRDELLALAESDGPIAPGHSRRRVCGVPARGRVAPAAALGDARSVEVPEPSPLFWEHFSARVPRRHRGGARPRAPAGAIAWFTPRWARRLVACPRRCSPACWSWGASPSPSRAAAPPSSSRSTAPRRCASTPAPTVPARHGRGRLGPGGRTGRGRGRRRRERLFDVVTPGAGRRRGCPRLSDEEQDELVRLIRAEMEKGRPS